MTAPGRLSASSRDGALARLAEQRYDVIVIGGGVTGAGVAVDAASRGLKTALVERADLASGTSRWSSKLIHGGLRYLARGDLAVAWESARERHLLMTRIAPHLVRPVPFLVPLDAATSRASGRLAEVGIHLGDALRVAAGTPGRTLPRPRRIGATEALALAPGLRREGLRGAVLYLDGQVEDDARLVVSLARTAASLGADIVTHCAATALTADSVVLTDALGDGSFVARGHIVNATGVWAGEHEPALSLTASRGSHLVLRSADLGWPRAVVTAPVPGHFGRYVFALPQPDGLVYLGLTDEPVSGVDPTAPPVPPEDEAFLLRTINAAMQRQLTSTDVVGRFAGLRPLVSGRGDGTADISRRHLLLDDPDRPVTIAGGKMTTYRVMAADAVDAVCRRMGVARACSTARLPLLGAGTAAELASLAAPARFVRRYGALAPELVALTRARPELGDQVLPDQPTTWAELVYGALAEGGLTAADLVERRTRIALVEATRDQALAAGERALEQALALVAESSGAETRR